ncbi:heme-binding protein 2-like [Glandiceps talaboti]
MEIVQYTTMLTFYVPVLLLLTISVSAADLQLLFSKYSKPDFCRDLDCPKYKVLSSGKGFEEREYEAAKYTSTLVSSMDYRDATYKGFMKLFDYISGNNKQGVKVEMAAPVAVQVQPGEGPACESNYTVNFFVPFADQDSPPEPSDPTVFITQMATFKAYVSSFPGYIFSGDGWAKHALELVDALNNSSITNYEKSYYYTAGYDSPARIIGRHNEIWMIEI